MAIKYTDGTVKHIGTVVGSTSTYYGDYETSYYAYVWNAQDKKVDVVSLGDDRVRDATAEVDADGLTIPEFRTHCVERIEKHIEETLQKLAQEQSYVVGDEVIVCKGRKLPKGTVAKVFWIGETRYGWSVGLTFGAAQVNGRYEDAQFVVPGNVKLAKPVSFKLTDEVREEIIKYYCDSLYGANERYTWNALAAEVTRRAVRVF